MITSFGFGFAVACSTIAAGGAVAIASAASIICGLVNGSGSTTATFALAVTAGRVQSPCINAEAAQISAMTASGTPGEIATPIDARSATVATINARYRAGSSFVSLYQKLSLGFITNLLFVFRMLVRIEQICFALRTTGIE